MKRKKQKESELPTIKEIEALRRDPIFDDGIPFNGSIKRNNSYGRI